MGGGRNGKKSGEKGRAQNAVLLFRLTQYTTAVAYFLASFENNRNFLMFLLTGVDLPNLDINLSKPNPIDLPLPGYRSTKFSTAVARPPDK